MYGCLPSSPFPLFLTLVLLLSVIKFSSHPRVGSASPTSHPLFYFFFSLFSRFRAFLLLFASATTSIPSLSPSWRDHVWLLNLRRDRFSGIVAIRHEVSAFLFFFFHARRDAVLITRDLWRGREGVGWRKTLGGIRGQVWNEIRWN